jgi:hypothetical protein
VQSHNATRRVAPLRLALAVTGVAALTMASLFAASSASAATNTLAPTSLTTATGSIGSGQTVANLAVKDQSSTQDDWNKYVEFIGSYAGHRTYSLPSSVTPGSVTAIEVSANYRGPSASTQTWTWSLYNWSTATWTPVGTNASAPSWGSWKQLDFASPSNAASFVNSSKEIRVRLAANNSADAADIDFESVRVTSSGGTGGGSSVVTLPAANGGFSYQLGGSYAPEVAGMLVSRDRTASPAGAGYYNVCYVNVFQTQPDEPGQSATNPPYGTTQWWINNHPDLLLKNASGNAIIDADWNEALFDVRTAAKREQLLAIQGPWYQDCHARGFQAIEPDNLDAFLRSQGLITFAQTKEYMKLVIPYVHNIGLAIAQKNTAETGDGYGGIAKNFVNTVSPAQGFDFAIAEECGAWEECDAYTADHGNLVFQVEYIENNPMQTRGTVTKTAYEWSCQDAGAQRSIILRDIDLRPSGTTGHVYQSC